MAAGNDKRRPHLLVQGRVDVQPYTYPKPVRGPALGLPPRERRAHGDFLLSELDRIREESAHVDEWRRAVGIADELGLCIEFESDPGFSLALKSFDQGGQGIELLAVREVGERVLATVFIPPGKLTRFTNLIEAYLAEETDKGRPKNQRLVESISAIRRAALESFWTDDPDQFPAVDGPAWWEVWLRRELDGDDLVEAFTAHAERSGIRVADDRLSFPDRTVLLSFATREQMAASVALLDCIAELRRAKEGPSFFTELSPSEQREWVDALLGRVTWPVAGAPAVCLLDTGVNNHPLLAGALSDAHRLACHSDWGVNDHEGHGTAMAGLALYGDLTDALAGPAPVVLEHRLESVKVLPPPGMPPNEPPLYGAVTAQAIARAEVASPERLRVACMPVTARDYRDRGKPSSWSAAVDNLCAGNGDGQRRLIMLAAGNVQEEDWRHYPDYNDVSQVQDPGQSWNALTVGAYTDKGALDETRYPGWQLVARPGTLSPSSSTSVSWAAQWPNKPDIVLEGGNAARDPASGDAAPLDNLSLLTTHQHLAQKLLVPTWATSAATAQAGRMAAVLMARYPEFWPETIRALILHSADWTPAMREEVAALSRAAGMHVLLRRYGLGVPSLARASWSAANLLTLVAQEELQPYRADGTKARTKDFNLHDLPWPKAQLLALGEVPVALRVTLSYFVESNPGRRGAVSRHRYASYGLRFAMKNPGEATDDFRARVSKDLHEDGETYSFGEPGWDLGKLRNRGSVHSDRWTGTAADLAARDAVAVFPVGGWWKERPQLGRSESLARYSLVVSIETPSIDVDIYAVAAAMIGVPVAVLAT